MHLVATIAFDLVLALTLLISLQIAAGWGELCGIRPGRDKSGLGGFAMLFVLFGIRWVVLAVCLAFAPPFGERIAALAAHVVLGVVSACLFSRGCDRVQKDGTVANGLGLFGSTVLPAPALLFAVQGVNVAWLGEGLRTFVAVGAGIVLVHLTVHERRRRSMLASRAS